VPHIILRTSQNLPVALDVENVLTQLVAALASCETIDSAAIKAYYQNVRVWVMGEGAPQGFAHCEVSLLNGRDVTLRQEISTKIFKVMEWAFGDLETLGITVEIREMDQETYRKA
jgi:5-carboxymethyl-2-hydroxymuconate isomerase